MKIDRALKIIGLIVGVLIIGCILTGIFFALDLDNFFKPSYYEPGVVVNDAAQEKLGDVKLELRYSAPIHIANSENYFLRVYISYKEVDPSLKAGMDSYQSMKVMDEDVSMPSNIIFLDKDLKPTHTLLNQRAFIANYQFPTDAESEYDYRGTEKLNFMFYEIVLNDTDHNGELDSEDDSDLYISAVDGSNLTQVTKGLAIESFNFLDDFQTILIEYSKNKGDENTHFVRYSVKDKTLTELTELDSALANVKAILTK